jgi:hypothetical protein
VNIIKIYENINICYLVYIHTWVGSMVDDFNKDVMLSKIEIANWNVSGYISVTKKKIK